MEKKFKLSEYGYTIDTGKYARQADGAVWLRQGDTVILATVVESPSKEFPGFLPLTIEYREHFAATGKIPGGYYKREGKPSDKEILTGRFIDRACRPLFPENYFNQVQIVVTAYSIDDNHLPQSLALLAASAALTISQIPFLGPVGAVEVARINNEWIYNPTFEQRKNSDVYLIVAGNESGICMVEGSMDELSETDLINVFFKAHEEIKKQVVWQETIRAEAGKQKDSVVENSAWQTWNNRASTYLTNDVVDKVFIADKLQRRKAFSDIKDIYLEKYAAEIQENADASVIAEYIYEEVLKKRITERIFEKKERFDGRKFDQIRPISIEVDILPRAHGSSVFTRGSTQALTTTTLGGGQDEQRVDDVLSDAVEKPFFLHYNFLPFSTGEVKPMRGPGRREVGHGYLAESALQSILPTKESFPYTIRVVTDIIESNGSSSMATVCGGTMALMSAGVPIKKMVSGVAMGLLFDAKNDSFQALTDINGKEDAYGLMDFKVAGTDKGVTAIQMDIKYKSGLPRHVFEAALEQARQGRLHILGEMRKVMSVPRAELSPRVPRVLTLRIPKDKIGAVIGSGGKVIQEIIERTGTTIDIEEDGLVKIFARPEAKGDLAISWVKTLAGIIEVGAEYQGIVKRTADFGIFVEIAPGQDGLVHISMIPKDMQKNLEQKFPANSTLPVKVLDYDPVTGRIRLKLIEK